MIANQTARIASDFKMDLIKETIECRTGGLERLKMKLLLSLFSCVYSRVKLFVFAVNSRGRYSIFVCFIYGLEEKNSKSEVIFAVCRLPLKPCLTSLLAINKRVRVTREQALSARLFFSSRVYSYISLFDPKAYPAVLKAIVLYVFE